MTMLRRVFFTSQQRIESFRGRPHFFLISITDPGASSAKLKGDWGAVLRISFRDLDPITFPQFPENNGLFNPTQAQRISQYIGGLPDSIDTSVVHCAAGISRSGGVAKAIATANNLYFPPDYVEYNRHVYETLLKVLTE